MRGEYKFFPKEKALTPTKGGFYRLITDNYWLVHPDKGLAFYWMKGDKGMGFPQCHTQKIFLHHIENLSGEKVEVEFLPAAWVPISLDEFR